MELQNLGNREVAAEVKAHKSSGALAPLVGHNGTQVRLSAGEQAEYKLQLPEETTGAWVRVREKIPSPQLSPVLAVSVPPSACPPIECTPPFATWHGPLVTPGFPAT